MIKKIFDFFFEKNQEIKEEKEEFNQKNQKIKKK